MGKENYIVTGVDSPYSTRRRRGYFSSSNLMESSPQSVYVYGIVTFVDSDSKRIGYKLLDDSISYNKQGTALPLYPNNVTIPNIGDTVPLVKSPTPDTSKSGGEYDKIFYYLDPTSSSSSSSGSGSGSGSGGILKPSNPSIVIKPPANTDDTEFYKEILTKIGASSSDENMKFFYAWSQGEHSLAAWNPFATTHTLGSVTPFNCNYVNGKAYPVKNYASRQNGIDATVATLKNINYPKLLKGLQDNIGADALSRYSDELNTWSGGAGTYINNILAGSTITAYPIARVTTKIATC